MDIPSVRRLTSARIPTVDGEFALSLYENSRDDKEHLALVCGEVHEEEDVLVRVHSECFTGDVLGSLRCDCGEQLNTSMRRVAQQGRGIILYLRQEGRGIGLLSKLKAYNLQDEGYDTVEANRMLGHGADERDYAVAATILEDLGVSSVRLLTNNPQKIESLEEHGIQIAEREPLEPHVNRHNADYLRTKVDRMRHILDLGRQNGHHSNAHDSSLQALRQRMNRHYDRHETPFVTLTYAQSLDGSIAGPSGRPLSISGEASLRFTHTLRSVHDGILVGIGTVLSDDPRLNVRRGESDSHPMPIVLDSSLRFPLDARLLTCDGPDPLILTGPEADGQRCSALEAQGADVMELPCVPGRGICLDALLHSLGERGLEGVMVEGGQQVLTAFLREQQAHRVIVTVSPMFVGGTSAVETLSSGDALDFPRLTNLQQRWYGEDLVLEGDPVWPTD
jgi:3,4-dihydroxy 2-butanone 4-phosphate synthase/GTP cyclohydrolase II